MLFADRKSSWYECFSYNFESLNINADASIDPSKTVADWSKFRHRAVNDLIRFLIEAVDANGDIMHAGGAIFEVQVILAHSKEGVVAVRATV